MNPEDPRLTALEETPCSIRPQVATAPSDPPAWRDWLRLILDGNPFYLLSAVLILWATYRLSIDPHFFKREITQLYFNFGSLQTYEIVLAVTAAFLAKRLILYDATLLVCVDNLLVFTPFVLISQAIFLDQPLAVGLGIGGALLIALRSGLVKRSIPGLNAPPVLLASGAAFLAAQAAFPVMFRQIHSQGDALSGEGFLFGAIQSALFWLLPALAALPNLLPRPTQWGGPAPQRSWLPQVMMGLWLAATAVHLSAIAYVYDLKWRWWYLIPMCWVAAWTLYNRLGDFAAEVNSTWRKVTMALPMAAAWWALAAGQTHWFLAATLVNTLLFTGLWLGHREEAAARQSALVSLVSLVAGMPSEWLEEWNPGGERGLAVWLAIGLYILLRTLARRSPKAGVVGALVVFVGAMVALRSSQESGWWALQCSLLFLLGHSLFWKEKQEDGAETIRWIAAIAWVANSWFLPTDAALALRSTVWGGAVVLLAAYAWLSWNRRTWQPWCLPLTTVLVLAAYPGRWLGGNVQAIPAGLFGLMASFVVFGLGTALAVWRSRLLPARTPESAERANRPAQSGTSALS